VCRERNRGSGRRRVILIVLCNAICRLNQNMAVLSDYGSDAGVGARKPELDCILRSDVLTDVPKRSIFLDTHRCRPRPLRRLQIELRFS